MMFFSLHVPIEINVPKVFTGQFLSFKLQNEDKGCG